VVGVGDLAERVLEADGGGDGDRFGKGGAGCGGGGDEQCCQQGAGHVHRSVIYRRV
jgi:hypothetical protein